MYLQFVNGSILSLSGPVISIWLIYLHCATVQCISWPTVKQEQADEVIDAQILNSVQQSMFEWEQLKKIQRRKRADKSVCYDNLGCFEDSGPFGYLDMLPSSPEEINTKFLFYSTKNRSDRPLVELPYLNMTDAWEVFSNQEFISDGNSSHWQTLKNFQGLDILSVRVIVHGFGSSCPHVWIYELRTALMAVEECIVICVDWENGANLPNYVRAAANTRLIGKQLAMFLKGLQEYKGLDLSRVHIIGFSLGAHVSGFAGAELPGLNRITGLDPAGPLFESQHPKARLDSTDASFVDVIHSNGENLILGGLGSWQPMGHVDFYPNGGRVQHGCSNLFVGAVTDFIWSPTAAVEGRSLCNHRRAYKFFIDSVAPRCLFPAFPCESYDNFLKGHCFPCDETLLENPDTTAKCGNMGYYADRSTGRGQLYLLTREEEPFCAHQFNLEIYSSENDLPLRTLGRLDAVLEGDGSLNETFSVTEKDDTELFAGDVISRILVPHPALGFPHSITVTYKSYSGWLSKGLGKWTIHKLVLTDSFGRKMSMCKRNISLISDKPIYFKLENGDCFLVDEHDSNNVSDDTTVRTEQSPIRSDYNITQDYKHSTITTQSNGKDRMRNKKDIISLGSNFKITSNTTYAFVKITDPLPWHPVIENLLDHDTSNDDNRDITSNLSKINSSINNLEVGRAISDDTFSTQQSIVIQSKNLKDRVDPILKSNSKNYRKIKFFNTNGTTANNNSSNDLVSRRQSSYFTIQLLPFRLGELIERAERYARETLLPLISEQAPKLFGFGVVDTNDSNKKSSDSTPTYIPLLLAANQTHNKHQKSERQVNLPPRFSKTVLVEPSDFEEDVINIDDDQQNKVATQVSLNKKDLFKENTGASLKQSVVQNESRYNKNILSLLRRQKDVRNSLLPAKLEAESSVGITLLEDLDILQTNDKENLPGIHIELPTYKPTIFNSPN